MKQVEYYKVPHCLLKLHPVDMMIVTFLYNHAEPDFNPTIDEIAKNTGLSPKIVDRRLSKKFPLYQLKVLTRTPDGELFLDLTPLLDK